MNRLRMDPSASLLRGKSELTRIGRDLNKVIDLYLKDAMTGEAVRAKSDPLRAHQV
jgi:site-specific DNA recombinase